MVNLDQHKLHKHTEKLKDALIAIQKNEKNAFIKKAKEIHGDKYDYSKVEYKTNKIPVTIICHEKDEFGEEHGEFLQAPGDHLKGYGCSKCSSKYKPTTEEWIKKAKKIHSEFDYSKVVYKDNKTPVTIICKKHNEKFTVIPNNFINDIYSCPKCRAEYKHNLYAKTTEQFIEDAIKIHGNKYDYSKVNYINNKTNIIIICKKHGEFNQMAGSHLAGIGCPKCYLKSQTKLYDKLKESFLNEEILFETGREIVPWLGLQRFDIYFPKYNIAVEYNGEQHYVPIEHFGGEIGFENTLLRDNLKRKKCKENNCSLFEVKYDYSEEDYQELVKNIQNIVNEYRSKENQ